MNNINAMENINMIKETIEESKIYYKGLYQLCLILGIYHTIGYILSFLTFFFSAIYIVNIVLFVLVLICYLIIYYKEKGFSNKYYLSILNTWALMVIAVPICITTTEIIQYFLQIQLNNASLVKIRGFSGILLSSIILIVYSSITNKRYVKFLAIISLFVYLLLDNCVINIGIPLSLFTSSNAILDISSIYSFLITCIQYIVLGIYLKKKVAS